MKTKVIVLGQELKEEKNLKPIEFVSYLDENSLKFKKNIYNGMCKPCEWENIELVCTNFLGKGLDLMFAYDKDRNDDFKHCLYLGHFNDGVVE